MNLPLGPHSKVICISGRVLVNGALMARFDYCQPWYMGGSILALVGAVHSFKSPPPQSPISVRMLTSSSYDHDWHVYRAYMHIKSFWASAPVHMPKQAMQSSKLSLSQP